MSEPAPSGNTSPPGNTPSAPPPAAVGLNPNGSPIAAQKAAQNAAPNKAASEPRACPPPTAEELANKSQAEQERLKRKFEEECAAKKRKEEDQKRRNDETKEYEEGKESRPKERKEELEQHHKSQQQDADKLFERQKADKEFEAKTKRPPPGVNKLEYWEQGDVGPEISSKQQRGAFLSYDLFVILSVLGGFLALDHLYLRSPMTFAAKLLTNGMLFGAWWIYDAVMALTTKDVIKVFGLNIPLWGPRGIGAGALGRNEADSNHLTFFFYSLALFFGGIFGLDSFLVGDNNSGLIRLVCCISIIGLPIAFVWWFYRAFRFFTNTKSVISEYNDYFGGPPGGFTSFGGIIDPTSMVGAIIRPITSLGERILDTWNTTIGTVSTIASTVKQTGDIIKGMSVPNPVQAPVDAALQAAAIARPQQGGSLESSLNVLPYTLLGTFALIVLSGFFLTYRRIKNDRPEKDDTPPEPGVFRKSDPKKSPQPA